MLTKPAVLLFSETSASFLNGSIELRDQMAGIECIVNQTKPLDGTAL